MLEQRPAHDAPAPAARGRHRRPGIAVAAAVAAGLAVPSLAAGAAQAAPSVGSTWVSAEKGGQGNGTKGQSASKSKGQSASKSKSRSQAPAGSSSTSRGSSGAGKPASPGRSASAGKPASPGKSASAGKPASPGKSASAGKPSSAPAAPQSAAPTANPAKAKPAKGAKGNPGGNNGTIKIAGPGDAAGHPSNNPHPGCTFFVEWYGFDAGSDVVSTVDFAPQAPTSDVVLGGVSPVKVPVGGDPAGGGTDLDGRQLYTLSFDGEPHPKQGYHVKVTVSTPRSNGNTTKSKVFWVQPCEGTPGLPGTPGGGEQVFSPPTPVTVDQGAGAVVEELVELGSSLEQANAGAAASARSGGLAAGNDVAADDAQAPVPGAVDAGLGGAERGALAALVAALLGGGVALAALVARRRTAS